MVIDDLHTSGEYKLTRILRVLESTYGLTIDFDAVQSPAELRSIYEEYGLVRTQIVESTPFNSVHKSSEYAKACLIQEAIAIFLSEVAPKRLNRRNKKSA